MPRRLSFTRLSPEQQPLIFLASSFIGGLLTAAKFSLSIRVWLATAVALWAVALVCWLVHADGRLVTAMLLVGSVACGGTLWSLNATGVSETSFRKLIERGELSATEPVEIWGMLKAAPELAPDRIYLTVETERVASLMRERITNGVVQIVVPFTDAEARAEYDELALDYGRRVRVLANLMNVHGYRNPGAPDFDEMLEQRGFDASASVKSPLLIERLNDGKPETLAARLYGLLYRSRARAVTAIIRGFTQPTSGVLAAALFGNRHFLSRDTAEAFREGGTFHLLVISGLHVAMIAAVVLWLSQWLTRSRLLRYGAVILLMWCYALMVGAQPAVTRSVVMLTVVLFAHLIFRESAGANTLAAAALALLAWQPRDLFSAGFQLSFLTVLMIVTAAVPLATRLRHIGEWQPSALTPFPPRCSAPVRWLSELLFWNEGEFRKEMRRGPIRYRLEKARAARWLSSSRAGRAAQWCLASIGGTLLVTTCVQVGLLPLMISHFHRFSVVSPLANVIESLLMFALMIGGAIYLFVYAVSASLAAKLAIAINALGVFSARAANPLSQWRGASVRVPDYSATASVIIYSACFALILILIIALNWWNPFAKRTDAKGKRRKAAGRVLVYASAICLAVLLVLIVRHPVAHQYEEGRLSVTFLDVGQGDAIVISFPCGAMMLLDSGGRPPLGHTADENEAEEVFVEDRIGIGEAAVAPYLWSRGIKRLDLIAASHGHTDHTQGFTDLARSFDIGAALTGVIPASDGQFDIFRRAATEAHAPLRAIMRGGGFELDGVRVEALAPFPDEAGAPSSANNQSLVLRLTFGNRTFLLTGDIEREAEERLLAAGDVLHADVLKVAHHGSRTSSTEEFIKSVAPQYAVISVAAPSPFGHPHPEILERLQRSAARVLQTSACGAITISTDGSDLRVGTFVKCESGERSGGTASRSSGER
ncbi:MAG TPA: ComEC/Rec2 family competence protein [Blastocatellia bacterium]|nr:ComEC/Rec2 family competence protein [Blastocatellia bacterium]